ncbi:MAG: hypothetical protein J7L04_07750 [Bacteroidales bacterium]|nr:hypothetical protein [Bacteroidales bacterium]
MRIILSGKLGIAIGISLALILNACKEDESKKDTIDSFEEFSELFSDPPATYRSAPLWDWNDDITKEGISFQMEEFRKAGIGGVFVHPRPGLITEYLSDEWYQLFDYTVQRGKELGMQVWIYDENSYPSGFAGGHVPAQMPDSYKHGTGMSVETQEILSILPDDSFEVVLKKTETGFINITSSYDNELGKNGEYYLFKLTYPSKSLWYGGFSYVDLLYPGVTEKFLELTMNGYEKYNKQDFGKTLKGIFTDEPNLEACMTRETVFRWTPALWDEFNKRWAYDLKVHLPSLIHETGDWKKVRHDYYELILELFIDRWAKPYSKYCEENDLKWTGHYWEHGWPVPTHGFDEAAFYIWHQQPGVDMLGCRLDPDGLGGQFGNTRAVRELRSAANQAGRTRTLSETYGGGGWEMDFEKMKRLADWQCVFGVNFVNQHLSYFNLEGVRKFDYPPSFSYHEPWWENYRLLGDYIARISLATSVGEQINKTLVLQPNTSAWMYFSRLQKNNRIDSIKHNFKSFVHQLELNHYEYDLGSENVLKQLASVDNKGLVVGKRTYGLVVIPKDMENIDKSTYNLLSDFLINGGKILSFAKDVNRIDGAESDLAKELMNQYSKQWTFAENIEESVVSGLLSQKDFVIVEHQISNEFFHQRRILSDGQLLFLVNTSETKKSEAIISVQGKSVVKLDLITGQKTLADVKETGGMLHFESKLEPTGSALYYISNRRETFPVAALKSKKTLKLKALDKMQIKRESDNILVLDYLDLKTSKSEQKGIHFMKALTSLFKENGIDFGNPWQHKIQYKKNYLELDTLFNQNSGFEVNYHFRISKNANKEMLKKIQLVAERPELWDVLINGIKVTKIPDQYWIDKKFPLFDIGDHLNAGENTVTLLAPGMSIFAEIMPVYILGDFNLNPLPYGFEIDNKEELTTSAWAQSGLPFYSQKVSYSQQFLIENADAGYKIKLNKWNGTVCEVFVNEEKAGLIAWPPYELDISDLVSSGSNNIRINVIGSLKNTFGYFYNSNEGWIHGPFSWNNAPDKQVSLDKYYLMDYGMFEPFELISY